MTAWLWATASSPEAVRAGAADELAGAQGRGHGTWPPRSSPSGGAWVATRMSVEGLRQSRWAIAWSWIAWPAKGCSGVGSIEIAGSGPEPFSGAKPAARRAKSAHSSTEPSLEINHLEAHHVGQRTAFDRQRINQVGEGAFGLRLQAFQGSGWSLDRRSHRPRRRRSDGPRSRPGGGLSGLAASRPWLRLSCGLEFKNDFNSQHTSSRRGADLHSSYSKIASVRGPCGGGQASDPS